MPGTVAFFKLFLSFHRLVGLYPPGKYAQELKNRLENYCTLKKYQMKSSLWIGLACIADEPTLLQGSIVLHNPWKYNAEMERRVASIFPMV